MIFFSILSGAIYACCFPKFNFGLWCAFVWPILLLESIDRAKNSRQAYWAAFLFSFTAYAIILYWIPITIWTWSHSFLATAFGYLILVSYLSFITGFFGLLTFNSRTLILIPACWTVIELARSSVHSLLGGFPWCLAGYSLANNIYLVQLAEIGGPQFLSFLIVFTATGFWLGVKSKKFFYPVASLAALLAAFAWGTYRYHSLKPKLQPILKAAVLQGNVAQYEKWDESKSRRILQTYNNLAVLAYQENADLVIWPETAYPKIVPIEDLKSLRQLNIAPPPKNNPNAFSLIGAVTLQENRLKNAALLFKGDAFLASYSKTHLVPFGEHVPWRGLLGRFISVLNELGDISAGKSRTPLEGPVKLGVTICYESIFTELSRELALNKSETLINITNDGWYLDTAAPYQHFLMNRLRAIETRLPLIRAANTGISAIINPLGEITRQSRLNEQALITGSVETLPRKTPKLLSSTQKLFPLLCLVVVIALSLIEWKRVKKEDL